MLTNSITHNTCGIFKFRSNIYEEFTMFKDFDIIVFVVDFVNRNFLFFRFPGETSKEYGHYRRWVRSVRK